MHGVANFGCFQGRVPASRAHTECNADAFLTVTNFACFPGGYVLGSPQPLGAKAGVEEGVRAQCNWLSHHGLNGATPVAARVASVRLGEHHGFIVLNRRLKATPEHPFLMRRGDEWGFASAEFVPPGDFLFDERRSIGSGTRTRGWSGWLNSIDGVSLSPRQE